MTVEMWGFILPTPMLQLLQNDLVAAEQKRSNAKWPEWFTYIYWELTALFSPQIGTQLLSEERYCIASEYLRAVLLDCFLNISLSQTFKLKAATLIQFPILLFNLHIKFDSLFFCIIGVAWIFIYTHEWWLRDMERLCCSISLSLRSNYASTILGGWWTSQQKLVWCIWKKQGK